MKREAEKEIVLGPSRMRGIRYISRTMEFGLRGEGLHRSLRIRHDAGRNELCKVEHATSPTSSAPRQ